MRFSEAGFPDFSVWHHQEDMKTMVLVPTALHGEVNILAEWPPTSTRLVYAMEIKWPKMRRRGPSVTEADIAGFELRFAHRLPDDYRQFILEVNGGRPAEEVSRFRNEGVNSLFSLMDKEHESRDLETQATWSRDHNLVPHPDLLYIGYLDGANILLALSGEHRGEVWELDTTNPRPTDSNPRVLWHDRRDMEKLADSFTEFLSKLEPL